MDETVNAHFADRQRQLLAELPIAPIVEILGVVWPRAASGVHIPPETHWTLQTGFDAWRVVDGPLHTTALSIRREVSDAELTEWRRLFDAYSVVRIRARLAESAHGGHQAILEAVVGVDTSDAELNAHAEQLQRPVTMEDPMFGTLTLDRAFESYHTHTEWQGESVSLLLPEADEVQGALRTAYALWKMQGEWTQRILDYAVSELLSLKNDCWLGDDEEEVTPDEFKERMALVEICASADGGFDFWFGDGELFWGHSITVSGTLAEGPTDANISG